MPHQSGGWWEISAASRSRVGSAHNQSGIWREIWLPGSAYDHVVSADPMAATEYTVRRSDRAWHSRITIQDDGAVVVVLPAARAGT